MVERCAFVIEFVHKCPIVRTLYALLQLIEHKGTDRFSLLQLHFFIRYIIHTHKNPRVVPRAKYRGFDRQSLSDAGVSRNNLRKDIIRQVYYFFCRYKHTAAGKQHVLFRSTMSFLSGLRNDLPNVKIICDILRRFGVKVINKRGLTYFVCLVISGLCRCTRYHLASHFPNLLID